MFNIFKKENQKAKIKLDRAQVVRDLYNFGVDFNCSDSNEQLISLYNSISKKCILTEILPINEENIIKGKFSLNNNDNTFQAERIGILGRL